MTYFRAHKDQIINASSLQAWRVEHLDGDEVFDRGFLREIIFGGIHSDDVQLSQDSEKVFQDWQIHKIKYEPHLNVTDGPYCVVRGLLHSVWRVYEDSQLTFVQSIWPSIDNNEYAGPPV